MAIGNTSLMLYQWTIIIIIIIIKSNRSSTVQVLLTVIKFIIRY